MVEDSETLATQEYLKIIGEMKSQARSTGWNIFWGRKETKWGVGVLLFLCLLGLIFGVNNDAGIFFLGLGGFCIVIGIVRLFMEIGKQENDLATNIDYQKTGFLGFFTAWKKERQKKTWVTIGTVVGFILLMAVAAAASDAKNSSEDVKVRRAVDEELDRRGK